nr:coenzyme F420-0:L-glutamate ligase [Kineococcus siccus]
MQVVGVEGIGEVERGTDLADLLVDALHASRATLVDGDVLVVSSKVVSKALGLTEPAAERDAVVERESVRTVAARRTPSGLARIVEAAAGPVMAAAGVDASNVAEGTVLVLPADPDAAARELRAGVRRRTGALVGVVVTDTAGRAWRDGQVDFALGCAGVAVVDDLRGARDTAGRTMTVTERALADEIAAAADLVKGKTDNVPAALVRGLAAWVTEEDGPGARSLVRAAASDWFRLGHVEAVRTALGADGVDAPPVVPGTFGERVARAVEVAAAGGAGSCRLERRTLHLSAADDFGRGVLAQRVLAALWTEDLAGTVHRRDDGVVVTVREARGR